MDVQMPVMDGFKATSAIREAETGTDKHLPIIAMTAHAMAGYREKCLKAGMDGYVTKPVDPETLYEAIADVTESIATHQETVRSSVPGKGTGGVVLPDRAYAPDTGQAADGLVVDWAEALARVEDDAELLGDLVTIFLDEAPKQIAELRQALATGDTATSERMAHSLKGAAANMSAMPLRDAAYACEVAAREKGTEETASLLGALEQELSKAQQAFANPPVELGLDLPQE